MTLTILPIDSALYVHLWPISFNYSFLRQIIRNKMAYTEPILSKGNLKVKKNWLRKVGKLASISFFYQKTRVFSWFPGIPRNCEGFPGISRFPGIQKIREIKDHYWKTFQSCWEIDINVSFFFKINIFFYWSLWIFTIWLQICWLQSWIQIR